MVYPVLWEQKAFLFINTPFRLLGTLMMFLLTPVYGLMQLLQLPLMLLLMVMNVVWLAMVGTIMLFSKISRGMAALRPISFVVALPFLLIADFLVTVSPTPTPNDAESKMLKWQFVESFPYCHLVQ